MIEYDYEKLKLLLNQERSAGRKIVFTNGVFDLVHVGHLRYLEEARALGDLLVVALNNDAGVRRLKGDKRPIVPEDQRAELIAGFRCVDYVTLFDTPNPAPLVGFLEPHIYAKGGDYRVEDLPEAVEVARYGGEVKILSLFAGHSSTDIVKVVCERYGQS